MRPVQIPYVVGQWVRGERFYGRTEQLDTILNGGRDAIWLVGGRRVGKTSLLRQLELLAHGSGCDAFPLLWDLQGADTPEELQLSFVDALLDAEDRFEELGVDVAELETAEAPGFVSRLTDLLGRQGKRLLLLCDEAEELVPIHHDHRDLFDALCSALADAGTTRCVLAASVRLGPLVLGSPGTTTHGMHRFGPPLHLGPMTPDETRSLIRQDNLGDARRPQIPQPAEQTIRHRSGDHPYLVQLLCKRVLELGDLERACDSVAADAMVRHFFAVDLALLDTASRTVLQHLGAVPEERRSCPLPDIGQALGLDRDRLEETCDRLEGLGYVWRQDDGGLAVRGAFLKQWLASGCPTA